MGSVGVLLGAHESTEGGLPAALERAVRIHGRAVQIFVKSPNRWKCAPLEVAEVQEFRSSLEQGPLEAALAHASYLPNLASPDGVIWERSIQAIAEELERCAALGLSALVVHPGAHLGSGVEAGLVRIVAALDRLEPVRRQADGVFLLLELTAGQGSVLCRKPEELGWMLKRVADPIRLGLCLDTCHAFAAGFDLRNSQGYARLLEEIDAAVGLEAVRALHLNDSAAPLGSCRDRHANLGQGEIGWDGLLAVVEDPRWAGLPAILETPLGSDGLGHARDLTALRRRLRRATGQRPKRLARSK